MPHSKWPILNRPRVARFESTGDNGILLSSTVFALHYPAEKGNQEAIDFLVAVISDEKSRALWHGASKGLIKAANDGNETAKKALEEYSLKR